jgi:hypothetical protein
LVSSYIIIIVIICYGTFSHILTGDLAGYPNSRLPLMREMSSCLHSLPAALAKILTAPLQFFYIADVTFYGISFKDETYKLRNFICVKKTSSL